MASRTATPSSSPKIPQVVLVQPLLWQGTPLLGRPSSKSLRARASPSLCRCKASKYCFRSPLLASLFPPHLEFPQGPFEISSASQSTIVHCNKPPLSLSPTLSQTLSCNSTQSRCPSSQQPQFLISTPFHLVLPSSRLELVSTPMRYSR